MKKIILFAFSLCFSVVIYAQVSKTASLTAGSLSTALSTIELNTITNLTLTGTIDARDFKTMRDNMPLPAEIDLNNATVAAYTGTEGTSGSSSTPYPANTITDISFFNLSTDVGKTSLTSIVLPSSVSSIGNYAFFDSLGLTSQTIPSSVTMIGSYATLHCIGLTSVTIPSSVTSIGNNAFSRFRGLTSVIIPPSVTTIGSEAFTQLSKQRIWFL